jgi:histidinol-phosphate aminotransferase
MFELEDHIRENIKKLKAYSSARSEFKGSGSVFLDANENCYGSPLHENFNRYPDPLQWELKEKISSIKGVPPQNIFLGNGSDEAIDLLFRIFCNPAKDNVIVCPPTYGMYEVSAAINDVSIIKVPLHSSFLLDVEGILESQNSHSKLLFICSPNNPTGNSFHPDDIELLVQKFNGIVVIDEAYINYSKQQSFIRLLPEYENLVVLQTFSKAWGLASLRVGMAYASELIIDYLNKVKPPYNVNLVSQKLVVDALDNLDWVNTHVKSTIKERELLKEELKKLSYTEKVYESDSNFLLVKFKSATLLYSYLVEKGIVVRDRSTVELCESCLRITIGTPKENQFLLETLKSFI